MSKMKEAKSFQKRTVDSPKEHQANNRAGS